MTEYAHDLTNTSPEHFEDPSPSDPESELAPPARATGCALCDAPLEPGAERCASCGLWAGGYGEPVSRAMLLRVAALLAAVYVAALVLVALAR